MSKLSHDARLERRVQVILQRKASHTHNVIPDQTGPGRATPGHRHIFQVIAAIDAAKRDK